MIFGKQSDFAIEAMIEAHLVAPSNPWGRLCIWVAGTPIGDFGDPHCSLYSCDRGLRTTAAQLDQLWTDEFAGLTDRDIWNFLDGRLYGYHGNVELQDERTLEEILRDTETYTRFDFLTNWGEMFDRGGKSFILKPPNENVKILNYDEQRDIVDSHRCSEFSFRRATVEFANWYAEQVKRLT